MLIATPIMESDVTSCYLDSTFNEQCYKLSGTNKNLQGQWSIHLTPTCASHSAQSQDISGSTACQWSLKAVHFFKSKVSFFACTAIFQREKGAWRAF